MDEQIIPQQTVSGISGGGELSLYQYFIASPLMAGFNDFTGSDRKIFLAEYVNLSLSLKNYLSSTETAISVSAIGLNYQLEDSQVYLLAATIRELLTGKIFIKDFPTTLSSKLGIDDTKAGEIANKLISQSFGPIIEDLKRIQRSKFPEKIMELQKETRPTGLNQPSAKPLETKPQQLASKQQATSDKFKIPDLDSLDLTRDKQPVVRPNSPQVTAENGDTAKKSLEEELQKVASVIDLRNKPQE